MERKYYLTYMVFYLFLVTSCQENQNNTVEDTISNIKEEEITKSIVGTWKLIDYADFNESEILLI